MTILPLAAGATTWQARCVSTQTTQARSGGKEAAPVRRAGVVAWVSLVIVYFVWGSTYLGIRVGVETMPPLLMAAARFLVAGLIMFPLALRQWRSAAIRVPGRRWPSRREWLGCAVVGILLLVANGMVGVGEKSVPSGLAALLVATVPLWLLGLDAAVNHARVGLAPLAGLLLGLVGVALLSGLGGASRGTSVAGVIIIMAAASSWALGIIMARRATIPSSPTLASAMQLLAGGAALLLIATASGEFSSLRLGAVSARSWIALGYLIVFGSIVAFSAFGIAVRALPTTTVATYTYVNPVVAILLGSLILNERLTPATIAGGALIVGAVVLVVRRSPPAH
jgi:drug/metabolite transporter (DMT)-like permease